MASGFERHDRSSRLQETQWSFERRPLPGRGIAVARNEFTKARCSIDGCDHPVVGRGWCRTHYNRWHRHGSPLGGGTPKGALDAWLRSHSDYAGDECLTWPFHRKADGIAACKFRGRNMNAARAMCIIAHGEPPTHHHDAAHSCGKAHEACVNPNHLSWKTKRDNQADRELHGTVLRGALNPSAKLTDKEVTEIMSMRGQATHKAIADMYRVSRQHIGSLFSGAKRRAP
jgi:hypothetical protein